MGKLTEIALKNKAIMIFLTLLICVAGPLSYLTHPSREDPEIVIRTAQVSAQFPGMSPTRMEDLITRKLEEKIREIPEVEHINSTVQTGTTIIGVNVYERYTDMEPIWQDLRNKMRDVQSELPSGTQGPFVNDDYGEVAMATIALTGDGFSLKEMREVARNTRNKLYQVSGVRRISLFGVEPERIFVEVDNVRLSQYGISNTDITNALSRQNIILPGGAIEAGGASFQVEPSGNFNKVEDIENLTISIPGKAGQVAYLKDIAKIKRGYTDPPTRPAFFNGKPAIVISVSMIDLFDSIAFGQNLKAKVMQIEQTLPIGYKFDFITFQPNEITAAVNGVMNNLYQTIAVVLVVVMLALGWRTGLLVGLMVPLVMLFSILVMRYLNIELERMSLATLIISLGLLVDNGIVMSEEIGKRLLMGQERFKAAVGAGKTLALPLLVSSLTTIFAFLPLMLAPSAAGEYTRSISLVIAISLLGSWFIAMTILPMFCVKFLQAGKKVDEETYYNQGIFKSYRWLLGKILSMRLFFLLGIGALVFFSLNLFAYVPKVFFPSSERTQLQIQVDAPVGSNTYEILKAVEPLVKFLKDKKTNPEIVNHIAYVADGGPRFYLGLDPIDPDPYRAYFIANVTDPKIIPDLMLRIRDFSLRNLTGVRVTPKAMSMGPGEAGLVQYRIIGPDENILKKYSKKIKLAMRAVENSRNIKDDWENPTIKILVNVDQTKAKRAGVSSEAIANALQANLSGTTVTSYREGDQSIPVVLRAEGSARTNIDRLRTLNVSISNGKAVPLMQVATFDGIPQYSLMKRRDLERTLIVSGSNRNLSADAFDKALSKTYDEIEKDLPHGYRIEKGGELEDSAKAQESLFQNFPLAFALILIVLILQFNSFRRPLIILLTCPLVITGVAVTLFLVPGANFGFMAVLGLLALMGIVINNAIVLIDKIDSEREAGHDIRQAILNASAKRLNPILVTTATTALGLMPLIISRDILFFDLALVIGGGLIVGTLFTLGVVPVLYSLMFKEKKVPGT